MKGKGGGLGGVGNNGRVGGEGERGGKIVGYEGRMQASCSDELKALYMFTGVEPPTCSLAEIKEKLHFLMSILGIKSNDA